MSRTILVVEDNAEERQVFADYLEFAGGRLLAASNGSEGIRMAREHRPDLILMDLVMPVMDGWEALRRLQQDERTADIPVVAITAHHLPAGQVEEAGFCGYLEKPIAPFLILEELERCLGPLSGSRDAAASERQVTGWGTPEVWR